MAAVAPAVLRGAKINSKINGVMIGAQTYSFRDRDLDGCLQGMKEVGLGYAELFQGHIEPRDRAALAEWRNNPPLDELKKVRRKFDDAGIEIYALNYSFTDRFTDQQIEKGFEIAKALGVNRITASANVKTAARIDPLAAKHKIVVAMHNHSNIRDNEFARPEDFFEAMRGKSKYIAINLDIGHFTAAGFDPVSFLAQNHARIITLHIKDRKSNQGANVPFGEGDTKIKEVLQLLKKNKWPIPANIEYEYKGADTVAEMKKCFEYCKAALA
jgi:sugar phosphate isomerase/epimerase